MYKVITDKEGAQTIRPLAGETPTQRTERFQLIALLNGLMAWREANGNYTVRSMHGNHDYEVKWVRGLRCWGCTCQAGAQFAYRFPGCPCVHVATVLLDIGDSPALRTRAEITQRRAEALERFSGLYQAPAQFEQRSFLA